MAEEQKDKSKFTGLWVFLGLFGYVAACIGGLYLITGRIVDGNAFKAIIAGSLGSLFALLVLTALVSTQILERLKSVPFRKALTGAILSVALLIAVALFAWFEFMPLARRSPDSYFGAPDASYEVTFSSGETKIQSGAQIGAERWNWWVGFYFSIILVNGALGLWLLGSNVSACRRIPEKTSQELPTA